MPENANAYHNIQQLSDALVALQEQLSKSGDVASLAAQVQSLTSRVAQLEADVKAIKG